MLACILPEPETRYVHRELPNLPPFYSIISGVRSSRSTHFSSFTSHTSLPSTNSLDLDAFGGKAAMADQGTRVQRLLATFQAVRPILSAVSVLPLIPPQFRDTLRLFLATFDAFAQSVPAAGPDFKAGKDL